ncbi:MULTISPECIES: alpha/beta hydrolase [unclassified Streptomyces]|uniref:alpha/beta hydrolase n=1 Tax=unclassified Streptomyces TaxID=2593676 RepID=UPI003676DE61
MPTWQQLRDLKIAEYEDAADGWGKVSHRAGAARIRVDQEMSIPVRSTQKGETSDAAVGRLNRLSDNYQYLRSECGLIRTTLNALATELAAPHRKLKQALGDAEAFGFTVNSDGSVSYPNSVPFAPDSAGKATPGAPVPLLPGKGEGQGNANKARAEDIAERISSAVSDANSIDSRYAGVLRKLKAPAGLAVTKEMLADAGKDLRAVQTTVGDVVDKGYIPNGKTPAENKGWWDHLTQEQRDEYVALYPAEIGALDGIPSMARDTSNRMVLAQTMAQTQIALDGLPAHPPQYVQVGDPPSAVVNPEWKKWVELDSDMKGMEAIQARLDASGVPGENGKSGLPQAYVLGFDTKGDGRAIIANGNPDTADHTAVYVPGTGASLENAGGDIKRMGNVWATAHQQAPNETTSTITWIGYDAPDNVLPNAGSRSYAHDGAPALNQFMDGLQTVQGGPDGSHTTLIGHSYGTTTIGAAADMPNHIAADDIVVAGSPGMIVSDADQLDVGSDHVWAEGARNDPVPALGREFLGGHKLGVQTWNHVPYSAGIITSIPTDESFGAHRMDVDTSGHSGYWDDGSTSLENQSRVVVGQYNRVKE